MQRDLRDRIAGHGTGARFSTKLKSLTLRAGRSPKYRFISLMHLFTEDFLLVCFGELKRNKAPGIDAVTVEEYEANLEGNIKGLVQRLVARQYRPQPTRRVYIPKPNGDKRPLGIPAVEGKIVQMACKLILEAVLRLRSGQAFDFAQDKPLGLTFWRYPTDFGAGAGRTTPWMRSTG